MTIEELREKLQKIKKWNNPMEAHRAADDNLLTYINDSEVTRLFNDLEKWYE